MASDKRRDSFIGQKWNNFEEESDLMGAEMMWFVLRIRRDTRVNHWSVYRWAGFAHIFGNNHLIDVGQLILPGLWAAEPGTDAAVYSVNIHSL